MALSIVTQTPVIIDSASTATTTMVSASHTPPNDSLLVVIVTGVWAVLNGTFSISNTHTGTSAWTEFTNFNGNVSGETARTSIFVARCGHAPGAGTITVTRSGGTVQCGLESDYLSVAGSIGVATLAQTANATTTTATLTITFTNKPATASLVIAGVMDIAATTAGATPPAGFTEQRDVRDVQLVNHEYATQNAGSPVINPTWTALDTAAGSWGVAVEIAEAMMPLGRPRAVRRTLPRIRTRHVSPTPPQFNPPMALKSLSQTRQLRGMPVRRGHMAVVIPPQFNPPLPPPHPTQHRVWPTLFRRGRAVSPIPAQQAPPTNPAYATTNGQHRLWAGLVRRGRAVSPLPTQDRQAPIRRRSRVAPSIRRGSRTSLPPVSATPPPSPTRRPLRVLRQRLRQPQSVPAPTVVVPNPPYPTKALSVRRLAGWLLRRSRKAEQGWPQGVAPPVVGPVLVPPLSTTFADNGTRSTSGSPVTTQTSGTDLRTATQLASDGVTVTLRLNP